MTDEFDDFESATGGGDYWNANEQSGRLHLVRPLRVEPDAWGPGEAAVISEVVVLDERNPTEAKVFPQAKVSGKALMNQLQAIIDKPGATRLLGRLDKVAPKSGRGNPYWSFQDATDKDKQVARTFLSAAAPF